MSEKAPITLKTLVQRKTKGWERRNVFPHVDKPPMYTDPNGDLIQPEGSSTYIPAVIKERECVNTAGNKTFHSFRIEKGEHKPTGQEFYFHYSYVELGKPTRIDITFTNREVQSERRSRDAILFTELLIRKTPEDILGDVSKVHYIFEEDGKCTFQDVHMYEDKELGKRPRYMVFGEYIRRQNRVAHALSQIDVSHQILDGTKTLKNLLENITAKTPKSPLDCLEVRDATFITFVE